MRYEKQEKVLEERLRLHPKATSELREQFYQLKNGNISNTLKELKYDKLLATLAFPMSREEILANVGAIIQLHGHRYFLSYVPNDVEQPYYLTKVGDGTNYLGFVVNNFDYEVFQDYINKEAEMVWKPYEYLIISGSVGGSENVFNN